MPRRRASGYVHVLKKESEIMAVGGEGWDRNHARTGSWSLAKADNMWNKKDMGSSCMFSTPAGTEGDEGKGGPRFVWTEGEKREEGRGWEGFLEW